MDTLLLIETDATIDQALQQFPLQAPRRGGRMQIVRLPQTTWKTHSKKTLTKEPPINLKIVNCICKAIVQFTKIGLELHLKKRSRLRTTMPAFQIIVIFHQRHASVANSITAGFMLIGNDPSWMQLTATYKQNFRIANVWLMSCESDPGPAAAHLPLRHFFLQAITMRRTASIGLMTPSVIPSQKSITWLHPAIYTFSIGDTIHGSLTSHPNHVWFFEVLDYALRDSQIVESDGVWAGLKKHVAGNIYKYVDDQIVGTCVVPRGKEVDLIRDPPSF